MPQSQPPQADVRPAVDAQLGPPQLGTQPLRFLHAYWRVWQGLAARAETQLGHAHNLDLRAFLALSSLSGGTLRPSELAGQLGVPRYVVSRTLEYLDRLQALERVPDPLDARRQHLRLTPQGHALWLAALDTVTQVCGAPLLVLGEQLEGLTAALERLAADVPAAGSSASFPPKERDV